MSSFRGEQYTTSDLALARLIRDAGILIDIPEDDRETPSVPLEDVLIRQTGGVVDSAAWDLACGMGFMLSLVITINTPSFAISAFELEVPWGDTMRLLEDPLHTNRKVYWWRDIEFDRSEVLNHRTDVRQILPNGYSLMGLLLGMGAQAIPDRFAHGAEIPAFVTVIDQFMRKYRSPVSFWADRSDRIRRAAPGVGPARGRLFERPDPGFDHRATERSSSQPSK